MLTDECNTSGHDCGSHCPRVAARMPCDACGYPLCDARDEWDGVTPHGAPEQGSTGALVFKVELRIRTGREDVPYVWRPMRSTRGFIYEFATWPAAAIMACACYPDMIDTGADVRIRESMEFACPMK